MKQLLDLYRDILENGVDTDDRTGTGRIRVFGRTLRFDLSNGQYPLDTTRKQYPKNAIQEILMFIAGSTNIAYLHKQNVNIWNAWAVHEKTPENMLQKFVDKGIATPEQASAALMGFNSSSFGEIGPMYGYLWRHWPISNPNIVKPALFRTIDELPSDFMKNIESAYDELPEHEKEEISREDFIIQMYYSAVDQLNELVQNLKKDPYGSRHVVTALNPEYTPIPGYSPDENVLMNRGALMPCHVLFQCFVKPPKEEGGKKRLSLLWMQRSVDGPVGLPSNIAGYALLTHLLAHCTDMEADELVFSGGDVHIYRDQVELVKEQLKREPFKTPTIEINPEKKDLFAIEFDDIKIVGYDTEGVDFHPAIKYPVSV